MDQLINQFNQIDLNKQSKLDQISLVLKKDIIYMKDIILLEDIEDEMIFHENPIYQYLTNKNMINIINTLQSNNNGYNLLYNEVIKYKQINQKDIDNITKLIDKYIEYLDYYVEKIEG